MNKKATICSRYNRFRKLLGSYFNIKTKQDAEKKEYFFRNNIIWITSMWFVCYSVCVVLCTVFIVRNIMDYDAKETYTRTIIKSSATTLFPAITICNMKPLNKTSAKEEIMKIINSTNYLPCVVEPFDCELNDKENMLSENILIMHLLQTYINKLEEKERVKLGYQMSNMILSCHYKTASCTSDDFSYHYDSLYGNCYTFNSGRLYNGIQVPIKKAHLLLTGLRLEMFIGNVDTEARLEYKDGVVMAVHNQDTRPIMRNQGIFITPGMETNVRIKKNYYKKLHGYSDCVDGGGDLNCQYAQYINKTLRMAYNQEYCNALCLQDIIQKQCGCAYTYLPPFNPSGVNTTTLCSNSVYDECIRKKFDKEIEDCGKQCPPECNKVEYRITISTAKYPSRHYRKKLLGHPLIKSNRISNEQDLDDSVLKLNVDYETMTSTVVEEVPKMLLNDLVSAFGGTLSLFLGVSILSLFELFQFFFEIFYIGAHSMGVDQFDQFGDLKKVNSFF